MTTHKEKKSQAYAIVNAEWEIVQMFDEYLIFGKRELAEHYLKTLESEIGNLCKIAPVEITL